MKFSLKIIRKRRCRCRHGCRCRCRCRCRGTEFDFSRICVKVDIISLQKWVGNVVCSRLQPAIPVTQTAEGSSCLHSVKTTERIEGPIGKALRHLSFCFRIFDVFYVEHCHFRNVMLRFGRFLTSSHSPDMHAVDDAPSTKSQSVNPGSDRRVIFTLSFWQCSFASLNDF
jgi:hypothetical protein